MAEGVFLPGWIGRTDPSLCLWHGGVFVVSASGEVLGVSLVEIMEEESRVGSFGGSATKNRA